MALNLKQIKRHAKEYVELEARTKVLGISFFKRYRLFGNEDIVLSVRTTDKKDPEWWVIGGLTPMNLYSTRMFPDADIAYSLHHGLMLRMADRNYNESKIPPEEIGYDAFISHASEDKESVVKPLANILSRMNYRVWYDEFELRVGDSLRQSIDKGLVNSQFGVVVLSPAFFAKNWPQYGLNGLTASEMDGHKVILPIWHKVDREDVLSYSPTLADKIDDVSESDPNVRPWKLLKKALSTKRTSIKKIAEALTQEFDHE